MVTARIGIFLAALVCVFMAATTRAADLAARVATVDLTPAQMKAALGGYGARLSRPALLHLAKLLPCDDLDAELPDLVDHLRIGEDPPIAIAP